MLPLNNRVAGKGVLNKCRSLPSLAPAPARIQHDVLRQLVALGQRPVEGCWLVEVGASIHPVPFQGHVVRAQVTQLKDPGLNAEVLRLFNRDPVGNDEVAIHKDVAYSPLFDQPAKEGPPRLHALAVRHTDIGREAEFPQGERHLGDRNAAPLQVATEASEEQTDGAHQQQNRSVDPYLH